ncbi:hypothetical protein PIB30_103454 [Stylosanthes scabra]|uniref:Uncharacterized protein n=1 Tax=Stylosanthes scabra TaxID=79078 RepID=A0ABU6UY99_9FABA|nr:hypothetical protein [Stylosanthes scabra]
MPRVKRPTKKSRGGSSSMEPPPQDHPLAQWFYNKEDFDLYHSDFASRKVIPPRTKPGNSKGLPYAILWTALFKYVGIDLSQADKKNLGYNHCIDTHVLNHMKRNVQEAPQQEEQAPQQKEEAQPQEPQDQPTEQPSMHDMMQALLRIEQNQTNMETRLHRIERNQARMLRKIRRVEAYTFSEDEAEDDDDDLDWS